MGIEFYLIKDDRRELYDLGKHAGEWAGILAGAEGADSANRGDPFLVDSDVDRVTRELEADWGEFVASTPRYLRRVAEDVLRWAGHDLVRLSSDATHDGWRNPDGSHDEGRVTGSRYADAHPEWPCGDP